MADDTLTYLAGRFYFPDYCQNLKKNYINGGHFLLEDAGL